MGVSKLVSKQLSSQYLHSLADLRRDVVWSALMDLSLAALPWKILWKLQMRTAEKIGACVAMSLGIL